MTTGRFMLMVATLAGAPVPALPALPGRRVVAVVGDHDPVAAAWEAIHGPLTASAEDCISSGSTCREPKLRGSPPALRIRCASGSVTRTTFVARLLARVPRAEATLARLWTLLQAELAAEGLEPVEVQPGQLRFHGGVFTRPALAALASRARRLAKNAARAATPAAVVAVATHQPSHSRRRPGPAGRTTAGTEEA